jgi:hypothetical protein
MKKGYKIAIGVAAVVAIALIVFSFVKYRPLGEGNYTVDDFIPVGTSGQGDRYYLKKSGNSVVPTKKASQAISLRKAKVGSDTILKLSSDPSLYLTRSYTFNNMNSYTPGSAFKIVTSTMRGGAYNNYQPVVVEDTGMGFTFVDSNVVLAGGFTGVQATSYFGTTLSTFKYLKNFPEPVVASLKTNLWVSMMSNYYVTTTPPVTYYLTVAKDGITADVTLDSNKAISLIPVYEEDKMYMSYNGKKLSKNNKFNSSQPGLAFVRNPQTGGINCASNDSNGRFGLSGERTNNWTNDGYRIFNVTVAPMSGQFSPSSFLQFDIK